MRFDTSPDASILVAGISRDGCWTAMKVLTMAYRQQANEYLSQNHATVVWENISYAWWRSPKNCSSNSRLRLSLCALPPPGSVLRKQKHV
jgi:hypothetical protein